MDNPANCPENSSCPVGCPQGLGQPPHRSALQPQRGLPTFPQALRLITRSRETNPSKQRSQAIRQIRLSLLRQWHGWTLAEYRVAFQLRATTPTVAAGTSEVLAANTRRRVATGELPAPPAPPASAEKRSEIARRRISPGRSLAALRPDLVRELHPTRNGELYPYTLGPSGLQKLWWRCPECEHEWQTSSQSRVGGGYACPRCAAERRAAARRGTFAPGRSLAALRPELAAELRDLDPARSGRGHERAPAGAARSAGTSGSRPSSSAPPAMAVHAAPSSDARPRAAASPLSARSPRSTRTSPRSCTRRSTENWIPTASGSTRATTCGGAVVTVDTSGAVAYGHARPGRAVHAAPEFVSAPSCARGPRRRASSEQAPQAPVLLRVHCRSMRTRPSRTS